MLTVTQRLMSGLGQAGSDWAWSVSINDISYRPLQTQVASETSVTEELVSEPKTKAQDTHDNPSGTSDLEDLYDYYSENIR